ncbi:MBL fold metallo-hydrolase [Janthinobacterium sp. PC23-8]|uniref:MBL fold metallo-hydrolase n=1 Tax=Janthinobacterium sp. PC23-8 TaxID=2012679 RepID=UPI000B9740EE|nr:MBL fold metallo-hydrolase [Janthinobacterium sp. PC23-8]OYO30804.1 MBL fold metallo-hydrolase [Janthinobacterium sp. PC23-8]
MFAIKPLAALLASLTLSHAALAAAPFDQAPAPGIYRMMLGQFQVTALSDGTVTIPLDKLLTDIEPATLAASLQEAHLQPMAETSINAFLINTGKQLVLVDTGAGDLFGLPMGEHAGRLQRSLRNAGYAPGQIDAVLLTHIHADHSGGLSHDGVRLFPNAKVYVDSHDSDFWLNQANRAGAAEGQRHGFDEAQAMLAPYVAAGKLTPFKSGAEILPGIRAVAAPGHTPGHSYYAVESGGQKLLLLGDMIHAGAVQFAHPGTTIGFDVDAKAAKARRASEMADAAKNGYWVGAAHLSFPGIGHIAKDGTGYRWLPANYGAW